MFKKVIANYASLLVGIMLFGQLGFTAINYYFGVAGMSILFGAQFCMLVLFLSTFYIDKLLFSVADLCFFLFIVYIVINYLLLGSSGATQFYTRVLIVCLLSYFSGKLIGLYVKFSLLKVSIFLSVCYIISMGFEVLKNPLVILSWDRPVFFATEVDSAQGNATNIGITLGSAWIATYTLLILSGKLIIKYKQLKRMGWVFIIIFYPVILFFVGSRSSIVGILMAAFILLFFFRGISWRMVLGLPVLLFAVIIIAYNFLPDNRKLLIDQLVKPTISKPTSKLKSEYTYVNAEGNSLEMRASLNAEAIRLFKSSPLIGIGSTNYGLQYHGEIGEFVSPHNLFTQILAENGIVGFILFFLLLILLGLMFFNFSRRNTFSEQPAVYIIFSMWLCVMVQEQFIGNIYYDYHPFLLSGLLSGMLANKNFSPSLVRNSIQVDIKG